MNAQQHDNAVSQVAAAIAEPARTKMLCALMDGHARTSTELAAIADVSASTASAHLGKLKDLALVRLHVQGRHRYYSLADKRVAQALEALMVIGRNAMPAFSPRTPDRLQFARTCYDHMAGTLAVQLHDRLLDAGWLQEPQEGAQEYSLSPAGEGFSPDWASMCGPWRPCVDALPARAWTGACAARIWVVRWEPRCCRRRSGANG